jgi:CheY-like chemotaxis protein
MTDTRFPKTVLVIDDNEVNRYAISKILASRGVSVLQADTGEEGIRMASQQPDVVLMDIHLPDMTGYDALKRLRSNEATALLPVILISATEPAPNARNAATALGVQSFLTVPVISEDLWIVIEATLHRSRHQAS